MRFSGNEVNQYVYKFSEGDASMRDLLGGKGAGVAEMTKLGMPVPEGFTITTSACVRYFDDGGKIDEDIKSQIFDALSELQESLGKRLGDPENPLLVSVRSGARVSMPGMMDTILNLGLNRDVVEALGARTGNPRWAWDSYRRFVQMYSDVVMGLDKSRFERAIDDLKRERGVESDTDLTAEDLEGLTDLFLDEYKRQVGRSFPADPVEQLMEAVKAVFRSWNNPRAIYFRRMNSIPDDWGTAVTVQRMVFGNMSADSGTGVAFSRNPSTGVKGLFGEYLMNAQGEDVVSGVRTPQPISHLKDQNPEVFDQFTHIVDKLELHYRDMQDMEFTIEEGKLYMLQTRNGKRTPQAAFRIASDLVDEGILTQEDAVCSIDPKYVTALLHPQFDADALAQGTLLGAGLPTSPGAASGRVVFTAEDAVEWTKRGEQVILVRLDTTPEDIVGMNYAQGVLTARGGMTSHAAVVARGIGRCCVSGVSGIEFSEDAEGNVVGCAIGENVVHEGDWISLDGNTGKVYAGRIATVPASISGAFGRVMGWADRFRRLEVRANADTPRDAEQAREFGAEGIGLVRTEHMFFQEDRITAIREMIVAANEQERRRALDKLLPMQRADFEALYEAMEGRSVTVRLIDPPLHEFIPKTPEAVAELAAQTGHDTAYIENVVDELREVNPMMGHRGCRLAITYPQIARMQAQAVVEAAINVKRRHPLWSVSPEIMVPLVVNRCELDYIKQQIDQTVGEILAHASDVTMVCQIGTMIETPRAAIRADEIAADAEFFSFGTNDLTQMTFGFSRDDAASFLDDYYDKHILDADPFMHLDRKGVGFLISRAAELGRRTRPNLRLSVCGEHGGDPESIAFCEELGLDYVSCSPYRVPGARLAAAQAVLGRRAPVRR
ncbi:pyruvate, phosphate dikinase [Bifidobacterium callitrichos]|uniref:Pyruvate, phosphate dikinase n=1 Tax=Bifidobacterium callitrichos TaxID=762209 RepID=A0A5M9ZAZ2_9BIFI|nr:pyruvate, phosphate dikinase [Bifidobacterium callitrichos]KAA8815782.1 pyruvate, phosphate dikinase [Bifidobacterium callitrichos]